MEDQNQAQQQSQPEANNEAPKQEAPKAENSDVNSNKAMAIIGYIIPILFFIPLLSEESKKSPFAKFHANQQLNILIFWIGGGIVATILSTILAFTVILLIIVPIIWLIYQIGGLVLMIMGIVNAAKGEMKKLPAIGGFDIMK